MDKIIIRGARENNLKNIDLEIPRDKLVVITGISGSGKSSLAFDTIFAEGQRRYIESLSSYARQFLGIMEKPDVDHIDGLSPAISIDQKSTSKNPRSTVGTITEIYDYLRLLYARAGEPHCPNCGKKVAKQTRSAIIENIWQKASKGELKGAKVNLLAPVIKDRKGENRHLFEELRKSGFVRARVDGVLYDLSDEIELDKNKRHTIEVVIDRLVFDQSSDRERLTNSIETALEWGDGVMIVHNLDQKKEELYSEYFACADCGIQLPDIAPRNFSFNSPHGACPACQGLGKKMEIEPDLVIQNPRLTLAEGAIKPWSRTTAHPTWYFRMLENVGKKYGFSMNKPVQKLSAESLKIILYGTAGATYTLKSDAPGRKFEIDTTFEGVIPNLMRRYRETDSDFIRGEIEKYMVERECEVCHGQRLKPEALSIKIADRSIVDLTRFSIDQFLTFLNQLENKLSNNQKIISRQILKEIKARVSFLDNVGLAYLTLDRPAATLAGGEAQRIRLATQIGSSLMGVCYILDEPSIGLHQRDNRKLLQTLKELRDLGNSVIVVEHDRETIEEADHVIDIGPGAGEHGGEVVAQGTPKEIAQNPASLTGQYLAGKKEIPVPAKRRSRNGKSIKIVGAKANNLQKIDVEIPLNQLVCVTGVSGSGKSTLVNDILAKALAAKYHHSRAEAGEHKEILGTEHLDKVINIDQSPIGRSPRSNPATYTGLFTNVRDLFAKTPEARMRGYTPGRFSFNVKGGRCENCHGEGMIKIEMNFLPDVYITCEECKGKRYNREALEIHYKEKTIFDVLNMTVEESRDFFQHIPRITSKLKLLFDVGLGYIKLGQPATTLSGGEAQRIKLASELSRRATGRTLYILDEPTTGLHFDDIGKLLLVLARLVDLGNSVLVIEHNLDVVKFADWIIDLGPEGGDKGGQIIAVGTPEEVAKNKKSYTGQYLKDILGQKVKD